MVCANDEGVTVRIGEVLCYGGGLRKVVAVKRQMGARRWVDNGLVTD